LKHRYRHYWPFMLGAIVVCTLSAVLLKLRYDLQTERVASSLRISLGDINDVLSEELIRGGQLLRAQTDDATAALPWQIWRLDRQGLEMVTRTTAALQLPQELLRRELAAQQQQAKIVLLGPLGNEAGQTLLVLAAPLRAADGSAGWAGAAARVEELMPTERLAQLMRDGYRLQWREQNAENALFQSDPGVLDAPIIGTLRYGDFRLQLLAAPRDGWHLPVRWWTSSLVIVMGVLFWLSYERRRGARLREAVDDLRLAEERRKLANLQYGKAIESVAALESRLQIESMYDTVTGLGNRSSLLRRLENGLDTLRQSADGAVAVFAIGFEHVHHISNTFGADFASRVLVVAAERVEFVLPSRDLLFRIGDFNLAVVVPHLEAGTSIGFAARLLQEMEAPISLDSHTFMLHPTVGIAEVATGYEYPETLLDRATAALGAVSRDAAERFCLFDSSTTKDAVSRLQLEVDLDRAFEEDQFVLEYEPIVMPVTNAVAGFEALIRWQHPTEGRLPPGRFVPIALQAGMAHRLNSWVMRAAARQAAAWRAAGYDNLFINFNLSAEAFLRPRLDEEVGEILAEFDLPGQCLVVELTETALIQDMRAAARILTRLSELGLKAWLDDFGTGYSSLSYLRALPLRGVKIDRSFVERTVVDARDFGFLKSLIDLISYLGMQSIAEGIETREQYELLSMTTCDLYQGYHFARSMPAAQAEQWMLSVGGVAKRVRVA
jgi:diguanylate cyclase (GGDEF)-like protein